MKQSRFPYSIKKSSLNALKPKLIDKSHFKYKETVYEIVFNLFHSYYFSSTNFHPKSFRIQDACDTKADS
jgi:hypothetical protein